MLVRNGPREYPGARYVVRDSGERIALRYNKRADTSLQYGWIIEQHLKGGDLLKMSIMSHCVKIMHFWSEFEFILGVGVTRLSFVFSIPIESFRESSRRCSTNARRLPVCSTLLYNTNFDGDEMNIQAKKLGPSLVGLLGYSDYLASGEQACNGSCTGHSLRHSQADTARHANILLWAPGWDGQVPTPTISKPQRFWTSKQILSAEGALLYSPAVTTPAPGELARKNMRNKLPPIPSSVPARQAIFFYVQSAPIADGLGRFATIYPPPSHGSPHSSVYAPFISSHRYHTSHWEPLGFAARWTHGTDGSEGPFPESHNTPTSQRARFDQ
ncbi:DNA-directed RNA polymerase II subunit rpb1 [Ceratobasidium sp. 395]|nr:DNA-directed RNA polymerase II subunit rpb1 [Ceratobasidium sp. 395]